MRAKATLAKAAEMISRKAAKSPRNFWELNPLREAEEEISNNLAAAASESLCETPSARSKVNDGLTRLADLVTRQPLEQRIREAHSMAGIIL